MRILTANQQQAVIMAGGYRKFVEREAFMRWHAHVNWQPQGAVRAEVCASSWRVKCPYCADALVAEPGEMFYCVNCCMQGNGGKAMKVIWPEPALRAGIEAVLLCRVAPETRNWLPHESLTELIRENLEHGMPVPQSYR